MPADDHASFSRRARRLHVLTSDREQDIFIEAFEAAEPTEATPERIQDEMEERSYVNEYFRRGTVGRADDGHGPDHMTLSAPPGIERWEGTRGLHRPGLVLLRRRAKGLPANFALIFYQRAAAG
jgi:hypothetical protein